MIVKLALLVVALASVLGTPAYAQSVDLRRFGLQDVATTAECASQRMSSSTSGDVVSTYWGPRVWQQGQCVDAYSTVSTDTRNRARTTLLSALSTCTGRSIATDSDTWVRRVGYATAVIAANGINDWATGTKLLDIYVQGTLACGG